MKIAIIGGGPGGLYSAALAKQLDPSHEIVVWERNAADDTFGFGVVFSDQTLEGIAGSDPVVVNEMAARFARWTDIDIEIRGTSYSIGGQGFAAMSRKELLHLLQQRCIALGVDVRFSSMAPDIDELQSQFDLVIGADGVNSAIRKRFEHEFKPSLEVGTSKYMWLGTDKVFEAFTFIIKETEHGIMQIHGYPYSATQSTFIVEMNNDVWARAGFGDDQRMLPPGVSDETAVQRIREIFADELGGHQVLTNNSKWLNFTTVRNESWRSGNLVLLGDAAHTAHFSIGSGTKLAMEDALALVACLHENASIDRALTAYEAERRPVVESTQRAAAASLAWFEDIDQYVEQDDLTFCFNLLTRSRRITQENLRLRDPEFSALIDDGFAGVPDESATPAMFQPFQLGPLHLKNRVIVSSMDMYSSTAGVPSDFHLVHLGGKALGGAGLVMTEMVCVSAEGRITPGCAGLYSDEQRDAWGRIVEFVHGSSTAKIGLQLGHAGRKGSTRVMWEGIDQPLESDNWSLLAPSPLAYSAENAIPVEMDRRQMDAVLADFVAATRRGAEAGFDLLELHCAHGYLLSSFLSPISNLRNDEYGGSIENRLRFPLEVFDAVRAEWPADRPVTVRISATDWIPEGNTIDDAVLISQAFVEHGAAAIDVSSGQIDKSEKPAYGRSFQTPFADAIRQRVARSAGVAVIAVGAISSYDDMNSILLAGRADLVALGRTHLWDPQWTLHAAADQGYRGPGADWPRQFRAGSRKPPSARTDAVRPRLSLAPDDGESNNAVHVRWQPAPISSPLKSISHN